MLNSYLIIFFLLRRLRLCWLCRITCWFCNFNLEADDETVIGIIFLPYKQQIFTSFRRISRDWRLLLSPSSPAAPPLASTISLVSGAFPPSSSSLGFVAHAPISVFFLREVVRGEGEGEGHFIRCIEWRAHCSAPADEVAGGGAPARATSICIMLCDGRPLWRFLRPLWFAITFSFFLSSCQAVWATAAPNIETDIGRHGTGQAPAIRSDLTWPSLQFRLCETHN